MQKYALLLPLGMLAVEVPNGSARRSRLPSLGLGGGANLEAFFNQGFACSDSRVSVTLPAMMPSELAQHAGAAHALH
eukprot:8573514-Pyramimonas_sp.AAC.1